MAAGTAVVCIICSNSFVRREASSETLSVSVKPVMWRFHNALERHFGHKVQPNLDSDKHAGTFLHSVLRSDDPTNEDISCGLGPCPQCSRILEGICEFYHEMKCLELKFLWRLDTLKNVMKAGSRIPARIKVLKEVCEKLDTEREVITDTCVKRRDLFRTVRSYRRGLLFAYSRRAQNPKIVLSRRTTGDTEGELIPNFKTESEGNSCFTGSTVGTQVMNIHSKEATSKHLLSLIIIILLYFSVEDYSRHEPNRSQSRNTDAEGDPVLTLLQQTHSHESLDTSEMSPEAVDDIRNSEVHDCVDDDFRTDCGSEAIPVLEVTTKINHELKESIVIPECRIEAKTNAEEEEEESSQVDGLECRNSAEEFDGSKNNGGTPTLNTASDDSTSLNRIQDVCDLHAKDKTLSKDCGQSDNLSPTEVDIYNSKICEDDQEVEEPRFGKRLRTIHRCNVCRKTFSSEVNLQTHKKTHVTDDRVDEDEEDTSATSDLKGAQLSDHDHYYKMEGEDEAPADVDPQTLSSSENEDDNSLSEEEQVAGRKKRGRPKGTKGIKMTKRESQAKIKEKLQVDRKLRERLYPEWLHLPVLDNGLTLKEFISKPTSEIFKYRCGVKTCASKFLSPTELEKHSKLHGEFKCNFCNVVKSYAPQLAIHEGTSHSPKPSEEYIKKFKIIRSTCPRCPMKFRMITAVDFIAHHLEIHMGIDMPILLFCPLCLTKFFQTNVATFSTKKLIRHILQIHDTSGLKPSQVQTCSLCPVPVNFKSRKQLIEHQSEIHASKYACDEPECAGRKFASLHSHRVQRHNDNPKYFPFECGHSGCKLRFISQKLLDSHTLREHPSSNADAAESFNCGECEKRFDHKYKLHIHTLTHAEDYDSGTKFLFQCPYKCPPKQLNYAMFQAHLKTKHDFTLSDSNFDASMLLKVKRTASHKNNMTLLAKKLKFQCEYEKCSRYVFSNAQELECHKAHHGNFACSVCQKGINYAIDLALHEFQHCESSEKTQGCSRCHKSFLGTVPGKVAFVKHFLQQHLQLPTYNLLCSICGFGYLAIGDDKKSIRIHYKLCHDVTDMDPDEIPKCDECPAYFRTFRQLTLHKRDIHGSTYSCKTCSKEFPSIKKFNCHLRMVHKHDKEMFPVACKDPSCSSKFPTEANMEAHYRIRHNGQPGFTCPKCDVVFYCAAACKTHTTYCGVPKLKKQPIRSHVCETCGKAFKDKQRLEVHHKVHLGKDSWDYCCEICGAKRLHKSSLDTHMRTHTQEKPYVCAYCGEKYAHRHNLRNHVNRKHGDIAHDVPRPLDKTNMTSRKGIPLGKRWTNETDSSKRKRKRPIKLASGSSKQCFKKRKVETTSESSESELEFSDEDC